MFACGISRPPKIILRKAVLIQGRIRSTKHERRNSKRGKSTVVGEIPKGSLEEEAAAASGLGPEGQRGQGRILEFRAPFPLPPLSLRD